MSKVTVAGVRANVQSLLEYANNEHKRAFIETVELQVSLKNYDTQRDKRFSGAVRLPAVARPNMSICVLGNQHDMDRARHLGIDSMSAEDLERLNKNRKLVKKLARRYGAFLASADLIRQIPRLVGPGFSHNAKFPAALSHDEDLGARLAEMRSTVRFTLRRDLCMAVVVGNAEMAQEELVGNIVMAINYFVSLLKKGWHNVGGIVVKSTMSPARRLY